MKVVKMIRLKRINEPNFTGRRKTQLSLYDNIKLSFQVILYYLYVMGRLNPTKKHTKTLRCVSRKTKCEITKITKKKVK